MTIASGAGVAVRGTDRRQLKSIADWFVRWVAKTRGLQLQTMPWSAARPAITFQLDPHASVGGDAGYRIVVEPRAIRVSARSPRGAFYGAVTLWQLLTPPGWAYGAAAEVPTGVIEDRPRFQWRGLLLDSARHFQRVADIQQLLGWMALEKLDVLVWHLTDDQGWRLEIPRYPALTTIGACRKAVGLDAELTGGPDKPYCGFYTEAQVRAIVRYAAARFITVVPEIDLPGHSQAAVAAYPWLGVTGTRPAVWTEWGVSPWLLKPNERTLKFVDNVLDEVMRLFPSRFISIGGDEADKQQWNASPPLRARMRRLGLANMDQLQGWFTTRVADHLLEHGRTPVGWDDELLAGAALPASEVVMSWHGSDDEHVALEALKEAHPVVLTPQESLYFDHYQSDLPDESPGQPPPITLHQAYDTAVVPAGASAAEARRVIGIEACLWTELVPSFARAQHALFPRVAALSELAWSPASAHDWNGFLARLTAEIARYRALKIASADSAFAPAFDVTAGVGGGLRIALANQTNFGDIRYTTDGSAPSPSSPRAVRPLEIPAGGKLALRAAAFTPGGFELAAPRERLLRASTLFDRDGSELATCSGQSPMRLDGARPARGPRPVYAVDVGNMCWLWRRAPLSGVRRIRLTVARVTWRFGDEAKDAIVRPKRTAAGEFEIHADGCAGPVLARLPLAPAARASGQTKLEAPLSATSPAGVRDLCILATGDPREGEWALARVALSR
jgi:hexosaminidase